VDNLSSVSVLETFRKGKINLNCYNKTLSGKVTWYVLKFKIVIKLKRDERQL